MHPDYRDIRELAKGRKPLWFDENAVPRYARFSPGLCNIYADEVALVLIACQGCRQRFKVAMSDSLGSRLLRMHREENAWERAHADTLEARILSGMLHYGDPPNVGCCGAGPVMNCEDLAVLEYWHRRRPLPAWVRVQANEIRLDIEEERDGQE